MGVSEIILSDKAPHSLITNYQLVQSIVTQIWNSLPLQQLGYVPDIEIAGYDKSKNAIGYVAFRHTKDPLLNIYLLFFIKGGVFDNFNSLIFNEEIYPFSTVKLAEIVEIIEAKFGMK
jgi:hypothetical protein